MTHTYLPAHEIYIYIYIYIQPRYWFCSMKVYKSLLFVFVMTKCCMNCVIVFHSSSKMMKFTFVLCIMFCVVQAFSFKFRWQFTSSECAMLCPFSARYTLTKDHIYRHQICKQKFQTAGTCMYAENNDPFLVLTEDQSCP